MKDFGGKIIVITGAGSGMGRAYALAFAREGSVLALCDLDEAGLKETMAQLGSFDKNKLLYRVLSVADRAAMETFAEDVKNTLGSAHVVINNAGIEGSGKSAWDTTLENYSRVMEVNYFGVVNGTQVFLPQLQANSEAVLVNVSSIFGLIGTPGNADYCASKFAVRGFTEALMVELNASHIQVHLLHPGGIATNIVKSEEQMSTSKKYLTTPPEQIVDYVIESIRCNRKRIVYGNKSMLARVLTHLLPLSWRTKLIGLELKNATEKT